MISPGVRVCIRCEMVLPLDAFTPHPKGRGGLQGACKACECERQQLRKHGVTSLDKEAIADVQGGCAICHRTSPGAKGWVVDHDRSCCPSDRSCAHCRRGILCQACNTALGYAGDDAQRLRRMADYLEAGTRLPDYRWSESVERVAQLTPTDGTDGLTKKRLTDTDISPLVTRTHAYDESSTGATR